MARQDGVPHPASPSTISFTSLLSTGLHHACHRDLCPHSTHPQTPDIVARAPPHTLTPANIPSHKLSWHQILPAPQGNVPLPHQHITFPDIADTMYSFPDCNLMLYRIPFPGHALQLLTQHHFILTTCGRGVGRGTLRCGGDSACRAGDRGPTGQ